MPFSCASPTPNGKDHEARPRITSRVVGRMIPRP